MRGYGWRMEESGRSERPPGAQRRRPALAGAVAARQGSKVDAMGLDKRRRVRGQAYGASTQRVVMRFVAFFAVVALLLVGLKLAVDQLDKPSSDNPAKAPWAQPGSDQGEAQEPLSADPPGANPPGRSTIR